ncbi:hypothetical protein [Nostoc sp. FACHB-190]|uniref:hypothetical protein n=1 Tax=Nostoc sp. FACHB-190 TaxID=2692838 RepID=UPI001681E6B2|nr:hypothetical protein [Nostoc sp. FACHB-190]MBD2301017.1 hypothetical protein [Nostoc sp. FACHB-190]
MGDATVTQSGAWGATALGRQRRGRVSRLEATVVGFADLKHVAWRIPQILIIV